jgi:hypothetical protein
VQAANALAAIGDVAVPALNDLLTHEDHMVRLVAANALLRINRGRGDAFKILVDGLQFADVPFRDAVGGWGANHHKYEGALRSSSRTAADSGTARMDFERSRHGSLALWAQPQRPPSRI